MSNPTFGSLFAGIGGIDLGLERAGWECRWQVEIDPYCMAVLKKHWPNVPKYGDIKELAGEELEHVDLIAGGFPCQPVSLAGQRRGTADERWLWPEFARIVRVLRPQFVLVENVPGLLSQGMGQVLGDLAAFGYDAEWESLPAAAVGAPHLRYRVFLVAYTSESRRQQIPEGAPRDEGADERRAEEDNYIASGDGQSNGATDMADSAIQGLEGTTGASIFRGINGLTRDDWWAVEPDVGRVAHGVPARVDRLRALGNAVVPQIAEWVGKQILNAWKEVDDALGTD